jgi:hypothetical protein
MKRVNRFLFMVLVAALGSVSQAHAQTTNASLPLFINGGGSVSPFTNGESLVVGQNYTMVATPDAGFAFIGWQIVNVFSFTEVTVNPDGTTNMPVVSTVASLVPITIYEASLSFVMQPMTVIYDVPGIRTVIRSSGWQADFEPVLNMQLGESAVILNWPTNASGFTLQATIDLASSAWSTNLPAPVIVNGQCTVTNPVSGTQQFFRLSQ